MSVDPQIADVLAGRAQWCVVQGDCLDILPTLPANAVDAVVTDPPYGMKYVGSPGTSNTNSVHSARSVLRTRETVLGDDVPFDPTPWCVWPVVMFGPQHYYERLPSGGSWHSWDKRGDYKRNSFADADFVWCSRKMNAQTYRLVWRGICRHDENTQRIEHPTQKPIAVMRWAAGLLDLPRESLVLDPYCGSGTTGVAAIQMGYRFIGIEREPKYVEIAKRRISDAAAQGRLAL